MSTFTVRVSVTLQTGLRFHYDVKAASTSEVWEKAHDLLFPHYSTLYVMPMPTLH